MKKSRREQNRNQLMRSQEKEDGDGWGIHRGRKTTTSQRRPLTGNHKEKEQEGEYDLLGDGFAREMWQGMERAGRISRRFPRLDCPEGVKVIARLKINLVSKKSFAEFGNVLGFWKFISADQETRENKMKPTLEDVFEAFVGAMSEDLGKDHCDGYRICYGFIVKIFERVISL